MFDSGLLADIIGHLLHGDLGLVSVRNSNKKCVPRVESDTRRYSSSKVHGINIRSIVDLNSTVVFYCQAPL